MMSSPSAAAPPATSRRARTGIGWRCGSPRGGRALAWRAFYDRAATCADSGLIFRKKDRLSAGLVRARQIFHLDQRTKLGAPLVVEHLDLDQMRAPNLGPERQTPHHGEIAQRELAH